MKYLFLVSVLISAAFIMRKPKEPTDPNEIKEAKTATNTRSE